MPKTSTAFPLLTKFYGSAIIILVLAMCCTCLVYALYFMNSSGLELHHASFFLRLKSFTLGRLQPLLFGDVQIPCRRNRNPDPKRRRSKVHPAETDLTLKEVDSKTDSQIQVDDQQFTTSREAPLIITSGSHELLARISAAGQEDQEGHLKLAKIGSSIDLSSSFSSFASFRSEEITAAVAREDLSTSVENINNTGAPEEIKKVTFACDNDRFVKAIKRKANTIHSNESAVKGTEHTLICSAGSSWFTQLSWDESLEENAQRGGEDVSSKLNEEPIQSMTLNSKENKSDSDTDDHATVSDGYVELSRSCDRENTKRSNTEQWKKAARILDRIFIIVLFMSIVISFMACLLLAPRVRNSFSP